MFDDYDNSKEDNIDFILEEFHFVKIFDTLQMLIGKLTMGYENESAYSIKGVDIKTLILILIYPNRPMCFYSKKLNMENGSFNYVAKKLSDLNLAEIVPDSYDKRKKIFVLTEEGKKEAIRLRRKLNAHIEMILASLSDSEKELFYSSMSNLNELALKIKSRR